MVIVYWWWYVFLTWYRGKFMILDVRGIDLNILFFTFWMVRVMVGGSQLCKGGRGREDRAKERQLQYIARTLNYLQ